MSNWLSDIPHPYWLLTIIFSIFAILCFLFFIPERIYKMTNIYQTWREPYHRGKVLIRICVLLIACFPIVLWLVIYHGEWFLK